MKVPKKQKLIQSLLESLGGKYTLKNNKPNKVFNDMIHKFKQKGVKEQVLTGKFQTWVW